jgi:GDP-L-fucose synthase
MIISPDKTFTIEQIVDIISKKLKYNGKIIFDKSKPDGILKKNTNNSIFKKYFIDFKFTDFDDALSETIEYFIKNYKIIRK